jgi:hypothetical protein
MQGKALQPLRPEDGFQHFRRFPGTKPISPPPPVVSSQLPLQLPSIQPNELACRAASAAVGGSWPSSAAQPPPLPSGPHPDDITCPLPPWLAGGPPLPPPDAPTVVPPVPPPFPAEPAACSLLPYTPPPLPPTSPLNSTHVAAIPCSTALHCNGCLANGPGLGKSSQLRLYKGQSSPSGNKAHARHGNGAAGRDIYPSPSARRCASSPYQPGPTRTLRRSPIYEGRQHRERKRSPSLRLCNTPPPASRLPGGVHMARRHGALAGATTPCTTRPLAVSPSLSCSSGGSGRARSLSRGSSQPVASNGYASMWGAGLGKRKRKRCPSQIRCARSPSDSPLQAAPAGVEKRGPSGSPSHRRHLAGAEAKRRAQQQSKESSLESGEVQSSGSESAGRGAAHAGSCLHQPHVLATRHEDRTANVSPTSATGHGQPRVDDNRSSSSSRSSRSSSSGSDSSRSGSPSEQGCCSSMGMSSKRSRSPSQCSLLHAQERHSPSGSRRCVSPTCRQRSPGQSICFDSDSNVGGSHRGSSSEASGRGKCCRSSTAPDGNQRENDLAAKRPRNEVVAA